MHRVTRGVKGGSVAEEAAWDAVKERVHAAITSALEEEEPDGS